VTEISYIIISSYIIQIFFYHLNTIYFTIIFTITRLPVAHIGASRWGQFLQLQHLAAEARFEIRGEGSGVEETPRNRYFSWD
jgi:hypothetical protein